MLFYLRSRSTSLTTFWWSSESMFPPHNTAQTTCQEFFNGDKMCQWRFKIFDTLFCRTAASFCTAMKKGIGQNQSNNGSNETKWNVVEFKLIPLGIHCKVNINWQPLGNWNSNGMEWNSNLLQLACYQLATNMDPMQIALCNRMESIECWNGME